ncbi:MAG: glycosyltransferase [Chroococcidiopsidaceae cyanobacterium CP_BM_RX_35]|nr:glycosyltransferase [Chroococcidiopsidaceae cyanobacterium CP_BM_RX_35]
MSDEPLKVLLVIELCNPDFSSDPLSGFKFFKDISKIVEATLVTHERNKTALEKRGYHQNITYIPERDFYKKYYRFMLFFTDKVKKEFIRRPLSLALFYPLYSDFNQQVYEKFKTQILRGDYDIVHAITPMHTRYPFKVVKACKHTPFLLGPVNGGVPFPEWFEEIKIKKYLNLSFLVDVAKFVIPGYLETYQRADRILAGSTFTLNMLKTRFGIKDNKISLFPENGISSEFLSAAVKETKKLGKIILLFVGRLIAFKCPDILLKQLVD